MNEPTQLIERFYAAFQRRDHAAMAACYHPDVHFSDPVFPDLVGDEARAMWHMLCDQGTDLVISFRDVNAADDRGSAHWEARYTFSPTGRAVHNRIDATFGFEDDLIISHVDTFNLWRWTRMALGATGTLTGWSNLAKTKVREAGDIQLRRFLAEHPEYTPRTGD